MSEERATPIAKGQGSNPAAPNFVPGVPTNFNPVYFEGYIGGVNTLVGRAAVQDSQMAWCDGFIPLGPDSLRCLPDNQVEPIYTSPGPIIVWYSFQNINNVFYCIILQNDGSVVAVQIDTDAITPILPSGTVSFANPLRSVFRTSQWEALYVLMVNAQPNGYWIWDGTNVYTAGTIGPIVTITDPGRDPALSQLSFIGVPQGDGSIVTVANSHPVFNSVGVSQVIIDAITVTNLAMNTPIIVGFGPTVGPLSTAFGSASIADGVIVAATLTNGGSGYTSVPGVSVSDGTGSGAVITVSGASGGIITALQVVNGGSNYSNPSLVFSGGGGSGAAGFLTVENGVIVATNVWSLGNGYIGNPTVNFLGPTGVGAVGIPLVVGGQVTGVTVTTGGSGYTNLTYYTVSDGNGPAAATVELMPFGVSGTAIEVYKSRVWISNGRAYTVSEPFSGRTIFSAANSITNFGGDGGAFAATDSFTRIGYVNLIQDNGFLWLIADNSLEYISNIQTNSVGMPPIPITTFSVINADPNTGSSWPSSCYVYGRNIVMSNVSGMYLSSGGAVTKVSEGLDGIWFSNPGATNSQDDFPGAIATIFGRDCYCMLLPLINKVTNSIDNYLMVWDGHRVFTSHQTLPLTFIASLSRNSYRFMYGTDGNSIHRLFTATNSLTLTKTVVSKLYANPSYWSNKTGNELHALFTPRVAPEPVTVTIDNEIGNGTDSASIILDLTQSPVVGPVPIGQQGRLMGLTITTSSPDIELNSMMVQERVETLNI